MSHRRFIPILVALALFAPTLAGCLGAEDDTAPAATDPEEAAAEPRVVIAIVDTGINLYHEDFRRDAPADDAPATTNVAAPDLPEGTPVNLSLNATDWDAAVDADRETLMEMQPQTLYSFPGTKIAGAISFRNPSDEWPLILDRPGYYTHGTMVSSRAAGNAWSVVGDDPRVDLVVVQGFTPDAVRWAADQDWIDVISISSGLTGLGIVPAAGNTYEEGIAAFNHAAAQKPFFASSGNGVTNAGVLGFPSWLRGPSGVPNAISVGANDNDDVSLWHNQDPYVVGDGCANPAATTDSTDEITNRGGGTSSATPYSAGAGAAILLEAREILGHAGTGPVVDEDLEKPADAWDSLGPRDHQVVLARGEPGLVADGPLADGVFTLREFKDVLYHTARVDFEDRESDGDKCDVENLVENRRRPLPGAPQEAVPEDPRARFPLTGYGEVSVDSVADAIAVLHGDAALPERPGDDAQYARAHWQKRTFVGAGEG